MDPTQQPQQTDPLVAYQQFRSQLLQRYGMAGGNTQQVSGPAMTGNTQRDRYQQQLDRGVAPFTAENMGKLASNTMGLMGGMGPVMTGATSMAEMAAGQTPGAWGGLQNFTGHHLVPMEKRRLVNNLVDYHEATNAAMGGGMGSAGDSHGQVSGGGTGSRGGGLTQGGPR